MALEEDVKLNKLYPALRFLVIDDFESFRSSIRLMLSSFGAQQVDLASSAEDALSKCRYDFYDVILCDYNLGTGKNGQQILEELRIRKRLKHTHLFIMITAETAKDVVLGAREYLPDAYIAKPITRTVLEQRLGQLLIQQKSLKAINKEIDLENHIKAITLCHQKLEEKTRYQSWCFQTVAKLYIKAGDLNSAANIYKSALASRELPWARIGLAQVLTLEQKHQEAKLCFEQVIKSNPNLVEAYDGMSEACLRLGLTKEAQEVLTQATTLSPRLVPRQEKLGGLCLHNNDIENAAHAFQMAVQFAENSVHDKPEHYLNLGRCLSEWSEGDSSEEGKQRAREALAALDKLAEKYSGDESACLTALLIEARVHVGQGQLEKANETLHKVESVLDDESELSASNSLEFARTLYSMGQRDRAEALLVELSARFANEPAILAQIESLMDEPEGLESRVKAKELNKSGIQLFEQNQLTEAVESFRAALGFTPRHAALNLNLAQVALKLYRDTGSAQYLDLAKERLHQIQHIPEQHQQYKRLSHLKKQIETLEASGT